MSAQRYKSTWRSITFNQVYDDTGLVDDPAHLVAAFANSDYRLESLDLTRVTVTDYREMRQYLEGAEPNEAYEGVRIIAGRGRIFGSSPGDLEDKAWALNEAFSPAACRQAFLTNDPVGVGPFDFKRDIVGGNRALRFYARPATGRPIVIGRMREGLVRAFLIQLVAFDARAYSQTLQSVALGNLAGGANVLTNNGTLYSHPRVKIVFSGAGSNNVILTNTTTGQAIGLDLSSAAAGETWYLDASSSKIYRLSDKANRYTARLAGYLSQFVLQPGANTITWSIGTGITSVTLDFRDAYA